jgi:transcriptional regulator with XRE-family HTH domain
MTINDNVFSINDEPDADEYEVKVGKKIKQFRIEQGLSLQELAEKTGFTSALLSQVENHMISPPLGTLIKISRGLDIPIGLFFDDQRKTPFTIVRAGERKITSRVTSKTGVKYGYSYESLAYDKQGRHMEPFLVTLEEATIKQDQEFRHEGEEFIFVLEGKVEIQLGEHTNILEPGDSIYFDSTIPHCVQCTDEGPAKILACIYPGNKND